MSTPDGTNREPIIMPDLGVIFKPESFNFSQLKNTVENIFLHLISMDNRLALFEQKIIVVPDFSDVMQKLKHLEETMSLVLTQCIETKDVAEGFKTNLQD